MIWIFIRHFWNSAGAYNHPKKDKNIQIIQLSGKSTWSWWVIIHHDPLDSSSKEFLS